MVCSAAELECMTMRGVCHILMYSSTPLQTTSPIKKQKPKEHYHQWKGRIQGSHVLLDNIKLYSCAAGRGLLSVCVCVYLQHVCTHRLVNHVAA